MLLFLSVLFIYYCFRCYHLYSCCSQDHTSPICASVTTTVAAAVTAAVAAAVTAAVAAIASPFAANLGSLLSIVFTVITLIPPLTSTVSPITVAFSYY